MNDDVTLRIGGDNAPLERTVSEAQAIVERMAQAFKDALNDDALPSPIDADKVRTDVEEVEQLLQQLQESEVFTQRLLGGGDRIRQDVDAIMEAVAAFKELGTETNNEVRAIAAVSQGVRELVQLDSDLARQRQEAAQKEAEESAKREAALIEFHNEEQARIRAEFEAEAKAAQARAGDAEVRRGYTQEQADADAAAIDKAIALRKEMQAVAEATQKAAEAALEFKSNLPGDDFNEDEVNRAGPLFDDGPLADRFAEAEELAENVGEAIGGWGDRARAAGAAIRGLAGRIAVAFTVTRVGTGAISSALEAITGANANLNEQLERRKMLNQDIEGLNRTNRQRVVDAANEQDPEAAARTIATQLESARGELETSINLLNRAKEERTRATEGLGDDGLFFGVEQSPQTISNIDNAEERLANARENVRFLERESSRANATLKKEQDDLAKDKAEQREDDRKEAERNQQEELRNAMRLRDALDRQRESTLRAGGRDGEADAIARERERRANVTRFGGDDAAREAADRIASLDEEEKRLDSISRMRKEERQEERRRDRERETAENRLSRLRRQGRRQLTRDRERFQRLADREAEIERRRRTPIGGFDRGFGSFSDRIANSAASPDPDAEERRALKAETERIRMSASREHAERLAAIRGVKEEIMKINTGMTS